MAACAGPGTLLGEEVLLRPLPAPPAPGPGRSWTTQSGCKEEMTAVFASMAPSAVHSPPATPGAFLKSILPEHQAELWGSVR